MKIECRVCQTQFNPNTSEAKLAPPLAGKGASPDLASVICPECGNRANLSDHKYLTGKS